MKYEYFLNINHNDIAKKEKVSLMVAKAIEAYKLKLDNKLKLESPYKYKGMQEVVGFLLKAINDKKKIIVYGDYDVDGICSISILKRMFYLLGVDIGYYVPNRYLDGYGLNIVKVEEISKKNYDIIICIDNGINANDAIKLAKDKGIEVVVLDHHELNGELPNFDYLLHPVISNFCDYNMCAASIAYYLSIAMLGQDDKKCAILAGIATISDVMPIIKQNKIIIRNAIKFLNENSYKNLNLLISENEYDENVLSMSLIPKINSVGRIIKDIRVNKLIKFLFEGNEEEMLKYVSFIHECNNYRKQISQEFYEGIEVLKDKKVIIEKSDTLLEGVCGIVASRLSNEYSCPAIIFSKSEDGIFYKGSARSIEGIDIIEVLSKLNYIVSFGGHTRAAGITLNISDYDRFKSDVEAIIDSYVINEEIKKVVLLDEDELNYSSYNQLLKYGPYGEANPYPLFGIKHIKKDKIKFSKDRKHLIIKLNNDATLLGFNLANIYEEKYNEYEAIFTVDKNNLIRNKLSCKCIKIIGVK